MKFRILITGAVICVTVTLGGMSGRGASASNGLLFSDNFQNGFTAGYVPTGTGAHWFYFGAAPNTLGPKSPAFAGDDGIATGGANGLSVVSSGVNPNTGKPAFTKTVGQNDGLPGAFDHVKWLVYANHLTYADHGYPGFLTPPTGQELVCQSTISGQTFGTAPNPFHGAVTDPNDDLRLAAVAMPVIDLETYSVFDTFITNKHIYAFYEHLPFGRTSLGGSLGEYAAFSSAVPIAKRNANSVDTVAFALSKDSQGNAVARWLVNGVELHRVTNVGYRPDRSSMLLDHGGVQRSFSPNQIDCGMGMFTLLDGYGHGGTRLVRLTKASDPPSYFDPSVGEPTPETFVDDQSLPSDRLWGQGAALQVRDFTVRYQPVN